MTLNNVIAQIEEIVLNHAQVNHFYYGQPVDWTHVRDVNYPSVLLLLNSTELVHPEIVFSFSVFVVSKTEEDNPAMTHEIQSDMVDIAADLISEIDNPDTEWALRTYGQIEVFDDSPLNEDTVAGVKVDIQIGVIKKKDRCLIPLRTAVVVGEGIGSAIIEDTFIIG